MFSTGGCSENAVSGEARLYGIQIKMVYTRNATSFGGATSTLSVRGERANEAVQSSKDGRKGPICEAFAQLTRLCCGPLKITAHSCHR